MWAKFALVLLSAFDMYLLQGGFRFVKYFFGPGIPFFETEEFSADKLIEQRGFILLSQNSLSDVVARHVVNPKCTVYRHNFNNALYFNISYYNVFGHMNHTVFVNHSSILSYNGTWRDNKIHGCGEIRYTNGEIYIGPHVNGVPEGVGAHRDLWGNIYRGTFNKGLRNGLYTLG